MDDQFLNNSTSPEQQMHLFQNQPTSTGQGLNSSNSSSNTSSSNSNLGLLGNNMNLINNPMTLQNPLQTNCATSNDTLDTRLQGHQQQSSTQQANQTSGNQSVASNHQQHHHHQQQQQQKSQMLPLLLSPRPPSLTPNSTDQVERSETDHEQIIEQVISLENEYSDTSGMMATIDTNSVGLMIGQQSSQRQQQQQQQHQQPQPPQQQHQHLGNINLGGAIYNSNFSSSSEDLLNLLLELDREPSNLVGLSGQQLDQDEKVGIENIRKQLMSCEVQSDQHQNTNSMSPIVNQMACQPQQANRTTQQHQPRNSIHQQQVAQHLISQQTTPVVSHHQPMSATGSSQQTQQSRCSIHQQQLIPQATSVLPHHQQSSADQSVLLGTYSNISMSAVPVSTSAQSYAPQQNQQQHVSRMTQSNPMSIVNSSPPPSWQQPQLSPYSPQPPHNNPRTQPDRQSHQHHALHQQQQQSTQHQTTTSPQVQQLHHSLDQRSPSQSVSPPVTTEPSPVVKKNPLLNAQLVNSRAPSITPTRFMNSQANVLDQNPILNAKLSQNSFINNSGSSIVGSPVNPSLNPQSRYLQQSQSNFNFDMTQQSQQNASQATGHMNLYGGGASSIMGNTSPSGGLSSQQVKQEIRRKVQPKQHQTSLLKQLLSDDNK